MKTDWNGWQYLFVFLVGFIGDVIVHILAKRNIMAKSLMPYYKSLEQMIPTKSKMIKSFNTWFWGGLFGGIACIIALLGADIILSIAEASDQQ